MSKRVGHSGDRGRCLYFTEPLIIDIKKSAIMQQRPANSSTELIAHKRRDGSKTEIEIVFGIECGISMEFKQRSVEVIASGLGRHLDDTPSIPSILGIEGLRENAD